MADLLLAPEAASTQAKSHLAQCEACRKELEDLRATIVLLKSWEAPELSPNFMTRLNARLEEERRATSAGWFERLLSRLVYGHQLRAGPIAAMALAALLLLGGGSYLAISDWDQSPVPSPQTAIVHDLQIMDSNAQLLDQLESISNKDGASTVATN